MKASPYNAIRFGRGGCAMFAATDSVAFEFFHSANEAPDQPILTDSSGITIAELAWATVPVNTEISVSYYDLKGLDEGEYLVRVGEEESELIRVTSDPLELENTVLMQYSVTPCSLRRDVYAAIPGRPLYFEARLPGGFKDSDWEFSVDCEEFQTQEADPVTLYAREATDKTLTIGSSQGLDILTGDWLNLIAGCPLLFVDGVRYVRRGSDAIEKEKTGTDTGRFVYSLKLREAPLESATYDKRVRTGLRRIPTALRRVGDKFRRMPQ